MKRDMDLVRKILLKIEDEYRTTTLFNIQIEGYDMETVAYHCKIMHEAGLVSSFSAQYGDNIVWGLRVGSLTWNGNDYLDKVRDDSVWNKTKEVIKEKGLPLVFETIKTISTAIITAAAEGVTTAILKNGGQQ